MTFADILADIYDDFGYSAAPGASVVTRVKRYVNEGLRAILGEPGLTRLLDSDVPLSITSVVGQARYAVPEAVAEIRGISERTHDQSLTAMTLSEYRRYAPDPTTSSGTPTHYVPIGRIAVAVQPSNASSLFVLSTAASDTMTAYVDGLITGGYRRTAQVTMTGLTAVNLSTAISSFVTVEDVYLSSPCAGTVTLLEDSGVGTELARITIGATRPRYQGFYLWPTPSAAIAYLVDYRGALVELVKDGDEPPLPADFHYLLSAYGRMRHYERENDARHGVAQTAFMKGLSRLKYATQTGPDELPVMGQRWIGHSRLGPYYPADTWRRY